MYFHPLILTEAQKRQRLAAWEEMARACLARIEGQHRWRADAFNERFRRYHEGTRAMLEALDLANELATWSVMAARMPLQLIPISMRSADIAAALHRKIAAVADIYVSVRREVSAEEPMDGSSPAGQSAAIRAHAQRQQVMA